MPDSLSPSPSTGSFRISVAGPDLAFRNEALADPVPTGRQIIEASGGRPADEYIVLEWLADGDLEELDRDETTDLRKAGTSLPSFGAVSIGRQSITQSP